MKFHWLKIISLAAIAMVRGQNNEISFFDERERERGGGRRDCPTFVENICIMTDTSIKRIVYTITIVLQTTTRIGEKESAFDKIILPLK